MPNISQSDSFVSVSKLFGAFFPTLFGVSYSGVEAPAARTQRRAGDPPHLKYAKYRGKSDAIYRGK